MPYEIEFAPVAREQLSALDSKMQRKVVSSLEEEAAGATQEGDKAKRLRRIRVNDHRLVFLELHTSRQILVLKIGGPDDLYGRFSFGAGEEESSDAERRTPPKKPAGREIPTRPADTADPSTAPDTEEAAPKTRADQPEIDNQTHIAATGTVPSGVERTGAEGPREPSEEEEEHARRAAQEEAPADPLESVQGHAPQDPGEAAPETRREAPVTEEQERISSGGEPTSEVERAEPPSGEVEDPTGEEPPPGTRPTEPHGLRNSPGAAPQGEGEEDEDEGDEPRIMLPDDED